MKKCFIINEIDNDREQEDASVIVAENQTEFDEKLKIAITEMVCADDDAVKFSPVSFDNCGCQIIDAEFEECSAQIRISENVIY